MSPVIATFPTWKELYGRRPSLDDVKQLLRPMDRLKTVLLLCQLSIHLSLDRFTNHAAQSQELQSFLISTFISDELFAKLKERYGLERTDVRRCFHLWQVLTLLKWAIVDCQPSGGADPDQDNVVRQNLGQALVMTNDLLMTQGAEKAISKHRVSEKRRLIALQLQLGSSFEINNPPSIKTSIVRTEIMFGEIARKIIAPLDINSVFTSRTGLSLNAYVDMVFAILIHYLTHSQKDLVEDPQKVLLNPDSFFRIVPHADVKKFVDMETNSLEQAASSLAGPSSLKPQHDFIAFRKRPLLRLAEKSTICLNPGFF